VNTSGHGQHRRVLLSNHTPTRGGNRERGTYDHLLSLTEVAKAHSNSRAMVRKIVRQSVRLPATPGSSSFTTPTKQAAGNGGLT